jgi:hypothetical protein
MSPIARGGRHQARSLIRCAYAWALFLSRWARPTP